MLPCGIHTANIGNGKYETLIINKSLAFFVGDSQYDFSFGSYLLRLPIASLTLEKDKNGWKFLRMADNTYFQEFAINEKLEPIKYGFPLLVKPAPDEIAEVLKEIQVRGEIEDHDLQKICEIVLRLRLDIYDKLYIDVKPDHVDVSIPLHEIKLKKVNNIWIVTEISFVIY